MALATGTPIASRASLKTELSRWENGHTKVRPEYRALFRLIYKSSDNELGFRSDLTDEIIMAALTPVSFREPWDTSFASAAEEWVRTVERREFLKGAAYVAASSTTPALQWLVGEPEKIERAGRRAVALSHVDSLREMTRTLRVLDNRYGGAHARETLIRFLASEVRPLVLEGSYSDAVGRELLSAAAEAVQLAGWMTFDTGLHGMGQRHMAQALRLAGAAGDKTLGAEILCGMSHQASYLKDGATAVDLARAAGKTARSAGLPALLAEAHVMEAHGFACLQLGTACASSLHAAEKALDRADRSDDPIWIGYFDEAYLSAKFGHCFKELRDHRSAQRFAERSLDMDMSYVRGRAFNLALLATAHAQAGEVESACAIGAEARELTRSLNSQRANEYLEALVRELTPYQSSPVVAEFIQTPTAN
jgi:hypothetical protein